MSRSIGTFTMSTSTNWPCTKSNGRASRIINNARPIRKDGNRLLFMVVLQTLDEFCCPFWRFSQASDEFYAFIFITQPITYSILVCLIRNGSGFIPREKMDKVELRHELSLLNKGRNVWRGHRGSRLHCQVKNPRIGHPPC